MAPNMMMMMIVHYELGRFGRWFILAISWMKYSRHS